MKNNIEIVALNFPPHEDREQRRIEKGKSTAQGLLPTSMVDKGASVLVTFEVVNEDASYDRYSEGDHVQKEYTKGRLEDVEKIKRQGEEDES